MRVLENNYGRNPIETAPLDEDVTLEVTDGRGRVRLGELEKVRSVDSVEQGNAARGHALRGFEP
jgi:hypothetical protein